MLLRTLEQWVSSQRWEDILGMIELFDGDQWERVYTEYIRNYPEAIKAKPSQVRNHYCLEFTSDNR